MVLVAVEGLWFRELEEIFRFNTALVIDFNSV